MIIIRTVTTVIEVVIAVAVVVVAVVVVAVVVVVVIVKEIYIPFNYHLPVLILAFNHKRRIHHRLVKRLKGHLV
jgi:E3 ubiquitin-protein ligase DOA10